MASPAPVHLTTTAEGGSVRVMISRPRSTIQGPRHRTIRRISISVVCCSAGPLTSRNTPREADATAADEEEAGSEEDLRGGCRNACAAAVTHSSTCLLLLLHGPGSMLVLGRTGLLYGFPANRPGLRRLRNRRHEVQRRQPGNAGPAMEIRSHVMRCSSFELEYNEWPERGDSHPTTARSCSVTSASECQIGRSIGQADRQ